jgi:hypothetical protein
MERTEMDKERIQRSEYPRGANIGDPRPSGKPPKPIPPKDTVNPEKLPEPKK